MQTNKLIRGVRFGPVVGAAGVQGFTGEGYSHHEQFKKWVPGFGFDGMGFVAKTVTLEPRPGNMPLEYDGMTPKEKLPDCIRSNFLHGSVLNAVGLSNKGAEFYFNTGRWQARTEPFKLSFMSVGKTYEENRRESREFVKLLKGHLPHFKAPIGLERNYSCPNTGHAADELKELKEAVLEDMGIAQGLNVAYIPKFNALLPPLVAYQIACHPRCDAICTSNTIPWGELPNEIPWERIFHSKTNPLAKYKGGGGSGTLLTEIVDRWVCAYDQLNPPVPLCAGGGVMSDYDALSLLQYDCVSSVFIGTAAILRPWRVQSIIKAAHYDRG